MDDRRHCEGSPVRRVMESPMGNSGWAVPRFHELSEAEATITAPCKQLSHPNGRTGRFKNAALHPMTIVWRYSSENQEYRSTTAGEAPTSVLGSE